MEEIFLNNLPKPLTKEETKKLFVDFNNGKDEARTMLISSNIRLVVNRVLTKFKNAKIEKNELVSIGNIGLIKAVDSFDISKGIDFSTYASRCIDNEIINYLKKYKNQILKESLNVSLYKNNDDETENTIIDNLADNVDIIKEYEQKELATLLNDLIDQLEEQDKKIIKMYFGLGSKKYTQMEISEKFNIKRTTLTMRINSILKKLKKELEILYSDEKTSKVSNRKKVKLKTIYEFFNNYTKSEINKVISNLSERNKQILELRFGKNLNERTFSNLSNIEKNYFYHVFVPQMKEQLEKNRLTKEGKIQKESKNTLIEKNDNDILKKLIITSNYFIDILTSKEILVLLLKLGFIGNEEKTIDDISKSLNIQKEEVVNIFKTSLTKIKNCINSNIEKEKNNIK